jgi:hypothetical protein
MVPLCLFSKFNLLFLDLRGCLDEFILTYLIDIFKHLSECLEELMKY